VYDHMLLNKFTNAFIETAQLNTVVNLPKSFSQTLSNIFYG